jgi:hypothetical protein
VTLLIDVQLLFAGINTGLYTRELMDSCKRSIESRGFQDEYSWQVLAKVTDEAGSLGCSTILVACFDG